MDRGIAGTVQHSTFGAATLAERRIAGTREFLEAVSLRNPPTKSATHVRTLCNPCFRVGPRLSPGSSGPVRFRVIFGRALPQSCHTQSLVGTGDPAPACLDNLICQLCRACEHDLVTAVHFQEFENSKTTRSPASSCR